MPRDNFAYITKLKLAFMVNFTCANPTCRRVTHGPDQAHEKVVNAGQAAHISAASEGGPRFDDLLTSEQRKAFENGVWLCASCATIIDRDAKNYPIDLLVSWQRKAQELTRISMQTPLIHSKINYSEVCTRLDNFLVALRGISLRVIRWTPQIDQVPKEVVTKIDALLKQCSGYFWRPSNNLYSLESLTVALQEESIQCLQNIYTELHSPRWSKEYDYYVIRRPNEFEAEMDNISDRIKTERLIARNYVKYIENIAKLREYAKGRNHHSPTC